jgi:hypothetical protein
MTLDPATRDLLVAVVDLEGRLRGVGDVERSTALAYQAGVFRGVLRGDTGLAAAAASFAAYRPGWWKEVPADAR